MWTARVLDHSLGADCSEISVDKAALLNSTEAVSGFSRCMNGSKSGSANADCGARGGNQGLREQNCCQQPERIDRCGADVRPAGAEWGGKNQLNSYDDGHHHPGLGPH